MTTIYDGGGRGDDGTITVHTKEVVLWRDYVDARFADRDSHVDDRFGDALRAIEAVERLNVERMHAIRQEAALQHASTEQAISVANTANEARFTSVEDLRGTLARYMPRAEFDTHMHSVQTQLLELAALKANERLQIERVDGLRRETEALRIGSEVAINKSEVATEKRFESVNEFRAQLESQAASFMPRRESEANWHRASDAIEAITKVQTSMITRPEVNATLAALTDRVNELGTRLTRAEGNKTGITESRTGLYAMLAAIAALVVIVNIIVALLSR